MIQEALALDFEPQTEKAPNDVLLNKKKDIETSFDKVIVDFEIEILENSDISTDTEESSMKVIETKRPNETRKFSSQLREVQRNQEDFEWYPTTDEIINTMIQHLEIKREADRYRSNKYSFLDIGAGNGKVLKAIKDLDLDYKLYAIEKSNSLLNMLPKEIFILGVDFWNTSLVDKEPDIIFCNPPYSEFHEWTMKIIKEAPRGCSIYMVIPERWANSKEISQALKERDATSKKIGEFSFMESENRKARGKVNLININISESRHSTEDPFLKFFNETFQYPEKPEKEVESDENFAEKIEETKIVNRVNFIEALCILYQQRMTELESNYAAICKLDHAILLEFNILKKSMVESLRIKLAAAKKEYWERLFSGISEITSRLTVKSRSKMLNIMHEHTNLEFNRDNAYAIVMWVVKNANSYFDEQLVETFESLSEYANVENYASNKRVFEKERFRYTHHTEQKHTHYRLKVGHRLVLEQAGGLKPINHSWDKGGLSQAAANFISDIMTVAYNLGYRLVEKAPKEGAWFDSEAKIFNFLNSEGEPESLIKVRTFLNGNMHIHFAPCLIQRINTEHGRLKGWLRNYQEAAEELEIPKEASESFFNHGFKIESNTLKITAS